MAKKPDSSEKSAEAAREQLRSQLSMLTTMVRMAATRQGLTRAIRIAMPVIRGYSGCGNYPDDNNEGHDDGNQASGLTPAEKMLLMNAGKKLASETIELATIAYPPAEGIEPYKAVRDEKSGCYPAPHLAHMLSVGKAIEDLFGIQLFSSGAATGNQEQAELADKEPILLTALNGDEYGFFNSPVTPENIRRSALSTRNTMITQGTQASTMRGVKR
jgi:hypothetical protein